MGNATFAKFKEDIKDMNNEELRKIQQNIKLEMFILRGERAAGYNVSNMRIYKRLNAIIETKLSNMRR